jgi:hypothetical protein
VVDGLLVKVLSGDDLLDDLLLDLLSQLLGGDLLAVLGRHNDGINSKRDNGTVVVLVLNGDLGFGVRSEPWDAAITASGSHGSVELVCQLKGQWEKLWGLVGGISKHDTLVTGTKLLKSLIVVKTLSDIWGLLLNGDQKVAGLVVEALGRVIVTNVLDGITDGLLVVEFGLGGNLTKDHDHTSLGGSLASDLGEGILTQAGIENGIRDLISDLIGVALSNGLGLVVVSRCFAVERLARRLTVNKKVPVLWDLVPLVPLVAVMLLIA